MPQISFNGKTYNDLAEMPATEREAYEQLMEIFADEDQDGTPDIFQGDVVGNIIEVVKKAGENSDGVSSLERMSPEMRARISKGIVKLYEFGLISGTPELSHDWPYTSPEKKPSWEDAEIRPSKPIIQSQSVIQEDRGPRLGIVLFIMLVLIVVAFGVFAYILIQ